MEIVWLTILSELSDLSDVAEITRFVLRIVLATVLGAILGYEREQKGKAAGFRTHILVSVGAAIFVFVPQQAGFADSDLSRIVQGLVAGIGFLGAGAIFKGQSERDTHGLTTAASLWLTAGIGMTVGLGRELTAILTTLLSFAVLSVIPSFFPTIKCEKSGDQSLAESRDLD